MGLSPKKALRFSRRKPGRLELALLMPVAKLLTIIVPPGTSVLSPSAKSEALVIEIELLLVLGCCVLFGVGGVGVRRIGVTTVRGVGVGVTTVGGVGVGVATVGGVGVGVTTVGGVGVGVTTVGGVGVGVTTVGGVGVGVRVVDGIDPAPLIV